MPLAWTALSLAGAILVFYFVLSPLLGRQQQQASSSNSPSTPEARMVNDLIEQREAALAGLAELDFDRNLGNISEADYEELRAKYRTQAVGILQALDKEAGPSAFMPGAGLAGDAGRRLTGPHNRAAVEAQGPAHVSRRAWGLMGGAIAVALLAIAGGTLALRGSGVPAAADAPALDVLHTHAALLIPGTETALVGHHGGLLRSVDGGLRWVAVPGVSGDVLALASAPAPGNPVFLTTSDSLMKSSDGGLTWEQFPLPKPSALVNVLAVGDGTPLPLYAGVEGAGLFRTTDLRTWEMVGGGQPDGATSMAWRTGPFAALYVASPSDGILATGDNGQTWGSANGVLNAVMPTRAVRSLAFDPQSGDRFTMPDGMQLQGAMYAATDVGLFKTIDGGSGWSALPLREPLAAASARSLPSPLMLAVDSRARVWRSTDRGRTWSAKP